MNWKDSKQCLDNYFGFPKETPELKFRLRFFFFFFFQSQIAIKSLTRMRDVLADKQMLGCNTGRSAVFAVQNQHRY